jgi:hypothetical protein
MSCCHLGHCALAYLRFVFQNLSQSLTVHGNPTLASGTRRGPSLSQIDVPSLSVFLVQRL